MINIIPITHESQVKGWHVIVLDEHPEAAAMSIGTKFDVSVDTVYQCGRRCFVPVNKPAEMIWQALQNGV